MEQERTGSQHRKIVRRSTEQIKLLMSEYENSGLSDNDFCKLHQIKKVYLAHWIKRYMKNKSHHGFGAVLIPKEQHIDHKEVLFAEYRGIHFYQPVDEWKSGFNILAKM